MDDLSQVGNGDYQAAKKLKSSALDDLIFWFKYNWIIIKSLLQCVPHGMKKLQYLIFTEKLKNVEGHVALITGAANGLGKEIAIQFAKYKCNLAIVDLDLDGANKTAAELSEKYSIKAKAFKTDVSNYESVQQLKTDVEASLGFVDILVNNAGVLPLMSLREGTHKDIQKIFDVNMASHFWTCRTFLNGMIKRQRGHIVAISSIGGFFPMHRSCAYCCTKFGVRGFMKSLYLELVADKSDEFVKLTTVFPNYLSTRQVIDNLLDSQGQMIRRLDPTLVAEDIVKGVLKNKETVILPSYFSVILKLIDWFPQIFWKYFLFNFVQNPEIKNMEHSVS